MINESNETETSGLVSGRDEPVVSVINYWRV